MLFKTSYVFVSFIFHRFQIPRPTSLVSTSAVVSFENVEENNFPEIPPGVTTNWKRRRRKREGGGRKLRKGEKENIAADETGMCMSAMSLNIYIN